MLVPTPFGHLRFPPVIFGFGVFGFASFDFVFSFGGIMLLQESQKQRVGK
jgi:hypothetical protein